jgi:hypothetical protein
MKKEKFTHSGAHTIFNTKYIAGRSDLDGPQRKWLELCIYIQNKRDSLGAATSRTTPTEPMEFRDST